METSFKDLVGEALLRLYRADRYMYNVAARLKILKGDSSAVPEGVRGYTNGAHLFLTDAWIAADTQTQLTTLTHETGHVIFQHIPRAKALPNGSYDHHKMNVAADLSMVQTQQALGQHPPICDVIPDWQNYMDMDMFDIYDALPEDAGDKDLGHPEIGDGGEGEHEGPSNIPAPSKDDMYAAGQAVQQATMQANIEGYSTSLTKSASRALEAVEPDKIPWDVHLSQITAKLKSDEITWVRPNRRLMSQVYLPSRLTKPVFEATMAMDVSGSVGQEALNKIGSIAQDILTKYVTKMHLMTFDDKIVDEFEVTRKDKVTELSINGYGGTYTKVVYDHLKEIKRVPKVLIIATDGYIPETPDPGLNIIWLIVDNPRFTSPFGKVIHIKSGDL